ncbi:MAG: LytTR family DNA-binding domain-containing protein [Clostridia bacterium]
MKIAIVDDAKECRDRLYDLLKAYDSQFEIEMFDSGNTFLKSDIKSFMIVFLDIEMPEIGGIEIAQQVLAIAPSIVVFFATNFVSYVSKALRIKPFQFLVKPIRLEDLTIDLDRAKSVIKKRKKTIDLNRKAPQDIVFIKDIEYIECRNKRVSAHMSDKDIVCCHKRLSDFAQELDMFDFVICHKSFLVNMEQINFIKKDGGLIMNNGEFAPISKGCKKEFLKRYTFFLNEVTQ